jgi:hypothetical protein
MYQAPRLYKNQKIRPHGPLFGFQENGGKQSKSNYSTCFLFIWSSKQGEKKQPKFTTDLISRVANNKKQNYHTNKFSLSHIFQATKQNTAKEKW